MSRLQTSSSSMMLLLFIFSILSTTIAQTTTYSTATSSPSANTYSTYDENGRSSSSSSPHNNAGPPNPDAAGASGASQTAISLNTGEQIAIGVVVGLVVIIGIGSAILFYLAKKRQWEVRASLRRSARRVTTVFKAKTPVKANFSRRDRGGAVKIDSSNEDKLKRSGGILKEGKARPEGFNTNAGVDRDVEKGFDRELGTQTKIEALPKPSPPLQSVGPKSSFQMDSPLAGNRAGTGKSAGGGWLKILGRK